MKPIIQGIYSPSMNVVVKIRTSVTLCKENGTLNGNAYDRGDCKSSLHFVKSSSKRNNIFLVEHIVYPRTTSAISYVQKVKDNQ